MGIIGGQIGYRILRFIAPRSQSSSGSISNEASDTKTELFFGDAFFKDVVGKTVIDFGCGRGNQSVEIALKGAGKVIGIDIQEQRLEVGKQTAKQSGVDDRCTFATKTSELGDIVISKDAFEHFADPAEILQIMSTLLKPNGYILASFGPTWFHPHGGHLFSVFPWSHLIFTEESQIRWRSDFKTDGATKFSEIEGGLNQLTIARFEKIVADSPLCLEWLETIPIKGISLFKTKALREIGSSIVRCKISLK
ncbi:MAG: methyltransferase domain-containing protein [Methylococcales bacterium]